AGCTAVDRGAALDARMPRRLEHASGSRYNAFVTGNNSEIRKRRIRIPARSVIAMIVSYARHRVMEQIRAVSFIVAYLVLFQTLVLGVPVISAGTIAVGIGMVVLGLAFFLEGLVLGIMPLGERVGVLLPVRRSAIIVFGFALLVGFGATLAEPAMTVLRGVGDSVVAWDAPLLFRMVDRHPDLLVLAIGTGVGVAVVLGMSRFYGGYSIKPYVLVIVPLLILVATMMAFDDNMVRVIGLAWDAGAVTTGAVTVPLILALSIGVSRSTGKAESNSGGFGVIMLASALPILAVALLGVVLNRTTAQPMSEAEFFSPRNRAAVVALFDSETDVERYAFLRGSPAGREALWDDPDEYHAALRQLATDNARRTELLGTVPLATWLSRSASSTERSVVGPVPIGSEAPQPPAVATARLGDRVSAAARAVIPLTVLLAVTLFVGLRSRPEHVDEVMMGVLFALVGMAMLTAGIDQGLGRLGEEVGRELPRTFRTEARASDRVVIEDFNLDLVIDATRIDGNRLRFFYLEQGGELQRVEFIPNRFDPESGRYEHVLQRPPLFSSDMSTLGIALVLLFAFGLGFGSTLAEPALDALGRTVEQLTVGTVKRKAIVRAVAVGVGIGLTIGVLRLIYDIPLVWLLIPPYGLLLPLTLFSEEDFAGIAWDSGGVTTGPITVPLVIAMGLSVGAEVGVSDGFGILALGSVYPILTVLLYGTAVRARQRRLIRPAAHSGGDDA
ncbi:MAG: DUF1538 domain-containing protein, partial [Spirochaetaceae bacterium]